MDDGGRQPRKKRTALDLAVLVLSTDEYGFAGGTSVAERDFAELRVKQWGKFARKHGMGYREAVAPEVLASESHLVTLFDELRELGYPLSQVSGLMEGSWSDVPLTGFGTFDVGQDGRLRPYRFVCSRLDRAYPDLVHDKTLLGTVRDRAAWYPDASGYELVEGAKPKSERKPGLLWRTPVGRAVSAVGDGLFGSVAPRVHSASTEFARSFLDRAAAEPQAFKYNWAVRGHWLVSHHLDGERGLIDNGKRASFLESFAAVRRLVG